jgi:hypothetical protein
VPEAKGDGARWVSGLHCFMTRLTCKFIIPASPAPLANWIATAMHLQVHQETHWA